MKPQIRLYYMLNDRQINLIKPPEKGRKSFGDINGLSLRVTSTNHKSWSIQYRVNGRKMRLTLGNYPTLSLKDARQLTTEKLNSIYKGQDPQHHRHYHHHRARQGRSVD